MSSVLFPGDDRESQYPLFGRLPLFVGLGVCLFIGCGQDSEPKQQQAPRPVTVRPLLKTDPPNAAMVTASVGSWKQEAIGFEVGGRVEFVAEPNTEIEGRVVSEDGEVILEGTPIGRIESERYQLQVERAESEVRRADNTLKAAQVELEDGIPAQQAAAQASLNLAKVQYERSQSLFEKRAGSESDVDRDQANFENAAAQIKQLDATKKAKEAEIESLRSALLQAKQGLRDAERDLEDCTLYSSFRGQISEVSVVPGSVVSSAQAIATLQMMDPIKVELEVSAEESRRLHKSERLPVIATLPDGTKEEQDGYLYLIDPVADPLTRTFTITLLVMNRKLAQDTDSEATAYTDQSWRLDFKFLPGAEKGMLFVAEEALLKDENGWYLWMITNATVDSGLPPDGKFKVRRLPVQLGERKLPFLGNWMFQQVIVDDSEFVASRNMVAGRLLVEEGTPEQWNGDTLKIDSGGQWMLRPGDLVNVNLAVEQATQGYFVPMDAIVREDQNSYIFVVDALGEATSAKKVAIRVVDMSGGDSTSGMRRIEPVEGESFDDLQLITQGAHYLVDGEPVKLVSAEVSE
ncbi:MAG: HlyD family efflux transporter periplasmic adaptor subunit [Fuerstiella sp.]